MVESHVLSGLIAKRAEIKGKIEHMQNELRQLIIDLDSLDATIRLFDPEYDLDEIKPKPFPPRHAAFKGEISKIVLSALRTSPVALSTKELAAHVMADRGLNTADDRLVMLIGKRVGACLRMHRNKGIIRSKQGSDGYLVWEVAS